MIANVMEIDSATTTNGQVKMIEEAVITPQIASAMIELSAARLAELGQSNRPLSPIRVKGYAADMASGAWVDYDALIVVTTDGRILNGQHTLAAVVLSGRAINALVRRDNTMRGPADYRGDNARPRTLSFMTSLPTSSVATTRVLMHLASPVGDRHKWSPDETLAAFGRISSEYAALTAKTMRGVTVAGAKAAVCFSMWKYPGDANDIAEQYDIVAHSDHSRSVWPAFSSAIRQCQDAAALGVGGSMSQNNAFARVAYSLDKSNRRVSRVTMRNIPSYLDGLQREIYRYVYGEQ